MAYFLESVFILCFSLKRKFVVCRMKVRSFLMKGGDGDGGGEEVRLMELALAPGSEENTEKVTYLLLKQAVEFGTGLRGAAYLQRGFFSSQPFGGCSSVGESVELRIHFRFLELGGEVCSLSLAAFLSSRPAYLRMTS